MFRLNRSMLERWDLHYSAKPSYAPQPPLMITSQSQLKQLPLFRNAALKGNLSLKDVHSLSFCWTDNGTLTRQHCLYCDLITSKNNDYHRQFGSVLTGISFQTRVTLCENCVGPLRSWLWSVLWSSTLRGGDIMDKRGDGRAADALLPGHWRDLREWSIEKRQSHRVRLFFHKPFWTCRLVF